MTYDDVESLYNATKWNNSNLDNNAPWKLQHECKAVANTIIEACFKKRVIVTFSKIRKVRILK